MPAKATKRKRSRIQPPFRRGQRVKDVGPRAETVRHKSRMGYVTWVDYRRPRDRGEWRVNVRFDGIEGSVRNFAWRLRAA